MATAFSPVREAASPVMVYRHSAVTRVTHWLFLLAFLALVSSGLEIFNAAPWLDASDKTDPAHRVLQITSPSQGVGTTTVFGKTFNTTGWLGWTDDGMGGRGERAFPGWITIPSYQDLADGRRWHFFFAWVMILCGAVYLIYGAASRESRELMVRKSDFTGTLPMIAYYLRLRKDPPPHGKYNPLQKPAYATIVFVLAPLLVITGFALSPGVDAWAPWLTAIFGGRQFARLWHFTFMVLMIVFAFGHVFMVTITGLWNNLRSMVTGWYAV